MIDQEQIDRAYQRGMHRAAEIVHEYACRLAGNLVPRPNSISGTVHNAVNLINAANPGKGFGE